MRQAFPLYNAKSSPDGAVDEERSIRTTFVRHDGSEVEDADRLQAADVAMEGVRMAQRICDTPPEEMTPGHLIEEAEALAKTLPVTHSLRAAQRCLRVEGIAFSAGSCRGILQHPPPVQCLSTTALRLLSSDAMGCDAAGGRRVHRG